MSAEKVAKAEAGRVLDEAARARTELLGAGPARGALGLAVMMGASLLRRDNRANTAAALERLVAEACEERAALLAACEAAERLLTNEEEGADPRWEAPTLAQLRAAIARARGGQ